MSRRGSKEQGLAAPGAATAGRRASRGARLGAAMSVAVASVAVAAPASALQPVTTFLESADRENPDNREALAVVAQRDAEAQTALGRLLPSLTARAAYTRNQYEVSFPTSTGAAITIQPLNQIDAIVQIDVPVFDPAGYGRYRAQRVAADVARESRALTRLGVQQQIVNVYYQLAGAEGLVASARRSVETAERNAATVRERRAAGVAA